MKRPDNVTPEDLAEWYRLHDAEHRPAPPFVLGILFPKFPRPDLREAWVSGCWLMRELLEAGCDAELAERICFAHGQVAYHGQEPWAFAERSLQMFRAGAWLVPGPELAEAIFKTQLPVLIAKYGPPDIQALVRFVEANGLPPMPERPFPFDI